MLKQKDMFTLSAIVDKMELESDINKIVSQKGKRDTTEIGKVLVFSIARKLHRAQTEVTQLLSSATGKTKKEIEDLPLKETVGLIKGILQEEGVMDFLSQSPTD